MKNKTERSAGWPLTSLRRMRCFGTDEMPHLQIKAGLFRSFETLLELVKTSAGINELLLAGIERMALAADFDLHIALRGTSLYLGAASALDNALFIFGMNSFLHFFSPLLCLFL